METKEINVLVGLDLSKMDEALIRFLAVAKGYYPLAHFTFLHNIKLTELPADYKTPDKLAEISERIKKRVGEMIETAGSFQERYSVEVTAENFSETAFLHVTKKIRTNLVILGNKQNFSGGGGLPQKLIRMWQIATLLVPETFNPRPAKIVQAIDFSRYTPVIQKVSKQILAHNQFGINKADAVYVSKVALQFFPGPSEAEIERIIKNDTVERRKRWKKEYPHEEELTVLPTTKKSIASRLSEYVKETGADLVIMGVLGASSLTGLFLGSVSNEFISQETNACILLVKRQAT